MPPINHLHPAIVHFPIVLLLLAPGLFLLGALWPSQRKGIHTAALILLLLGLLGGFAAQATGEASESMARRTPELKAALERHEDLATQSMVVFGTLAGIWILWLVASRFLRAELPRWAGRALFLLWMLGSAWGMVTILRTGHEGGQMVHELFTHADEEP